MKWILYVSENDESRNILYMLDKENPARIRKTVKKVKILGFGTGPYIQYKKKRIKKLNKILAKILPLPTQQSRQQFAQPEAGYNYNESLYGMIGAEKSNTQIPDEMDMPIHNDKERLTQRITEFENRRQGTRPEQVRPDPALEQQYARSSGNDLMDTLEAEEGLEKYFQSAMSGSGN